MNAAPQEEVVWKGTSSQLVNWQIFLVCGLFCWLVFPIFFALWKYFEVRLRTFEITTQRLRVRSGVLSRRVEEVELYRVKDSTFIQPWYQRMFGLGNVVINTSDITTKVVTFPAIKDAEAVRNQLRHHVELRRDAKRVRETDIAATMEP